MVEELAPVREVFIRGQNDGPVLIERVDQLEQVKTAL